MNLHARITPSARPNLSDHPRLISAVLALFLVAMCFQTPAMAGTFNVSDAAGLRAALLAAATNVEDDVIVLAAGTYATGGTAFTFFSNERNTLTLQGANGTTRDHVVLDGGGTSQVLNFDCIGSCGAITLQGLTVQGGISTAQGGAVTVSTALILSNSTFSNNSAANGGAIYGSNMTVSMTVSNSTFSNNTVSQGGGAISGAGPVTVSSSTFSNNTADFGGAITANSAVTVTNSTFSNNTSAGSGGAIYAYAIGTVTKSIFSNNVAGEGGGAIIGYGTVTVTNSIFSNNTATNGGAIYGQGIIVNNTFSGNSAVGSGAAIYVFSTSSIINSVFYGHSTPAIYGHSAYNLYNNLIDTSAGIAGSTPIMVGNVAPGAISPFVDAANGNFRLAAGSLAIDAGLDPNAATFANVLLGSDPASIRQALLTDLQGSPRPAPGTAVDIGAYEFGAASDSDRLFNYVEHVLSSLFGPPSSSFTIAQYYARCYHGQTVCIGTSGGNVYFYDGSVVASFGPLANFMAEVGSAGF